MDLNQLIQEVTNPRAEDMNAVYIFLKYRKAFRKYFQKKFLQNGWSVDIPSLKAGASGGYSGLETTIEKSGTKLKIRISESYRNLQIYINGKKVSSDDLYHLSLKDMINYIYGRVEAEVSGSDEENRIAADSLRPANIDIFNKDTIALINKSGKGEFTFNVSTSHHGNVATHQFKFRMDNNPRIQAYIDVGKETFGYSFYNELKRKIFGKFSYDTQKEAFIRFVKRALSSRPYEEVFKNLLKTCTIQKLSSDSESYTIDFKEYNLKMSKKFSVEKLYGEARDELIEKIMSEEASTRSILEIIDEFRKMYIVQLFRYGANNFRDKSKFDRIE